MKIAGALCILLGTLLWAISRRREGERRLALHKEAIRFLEFTHDRIALCGMPLPDILSDYQTQHPGCSILFSSPPIPLIDYLSGAGESGMEGELRRAEYHLSRLINTLPAMEHELQKKNQLLFSLSIPAALVVILLLL